MVAPYHLAADLSKTGHDGEARSLDTRGTVKITTSGPSSPGTTDGARTASYPTFANRKIITIPKVNPKQYNAGGPIPLVSAKLTGRHYPLQDFLASAWMDAGVEGIADPNSGSPLGISDAIECQQSLERVIASDAYGLKGNHVLTETLVSHVFIEEVAGVKTVTGVQLADGRTLQAEHEVVLSGGAIHTPKSSCSLGLVQQTSYPVMVYRNLSTHPVYAAIFSIT